MKIILNPSEADYLCKMLNQVQVVPGLECTAKFTRMAKKAITVSSNIENQAPYTATQINITIEEYISTCKDI